MPNIQWRVQSQLSGKLFARLSLHTIFAYFQIPDRDDYDSRGYMDMHDWSQILVFLSRGIISCALPNSWTMVFQI